MAGNFRLTAVLSVFIFISSLVEADDTHYQNYILGERAMGLGGAFTGLADDPSASYYNPAGIALIPSDSVSVSLNVYGYEHHYIEAGHSTTFGGASDLSYTRFPTIPNTMAMVKKIGKKIGGIKAHALGFSVYIPSWDKFLWQGEVNQRGEIETLKISQDDKTTWFGPSYAFRLTKDLSLGLSVFFSRRLLSRTYKKVHYTEGRLDEYGRDPEGYVELEEITTSLDIGTLIVRYGLHWKMSERFRFGIMLSPPSLRIYGNGVITKEFAASDLTVEEDKWSRYSFKKAESLKAQNLLPLNIRIGAAYSKRTKYVFSLDLSLFLPRRFTLVEFPQKIEVDFDPFFVTNIERNLVLNINIGGEYIVSRYFPFRLGFFTNLSSAPKVKVGNEPQLPKLHMFGGTFSIGYTKGGHNINFGMLFSQGKGEASIYSLGQYYDRPNEFYEYVPSFASVRFIYFFLSGATKAIKEKLKKLL
jgi:long-chain fatty acid transport protein